MIVSSFQTQYGIRLSQDLSGMSWKEFAYLLAGLNSETPLGRIVSIRAEEDRDTIKNFTPDQKRIRNEWKRKMAKGKSAESTAEMLNDLKEAFRKLSGGGNEET